MHSLFQQSIFLMIIWTRHIFIFLLVFTYVVLFHRKSILFSDAKPFFSFFFLFFNFTVLYWFCHISKSIRHRYTCVPHPEPPSLLPPHTIPLGRPSAPAPSIQYRASNLDWRLISYMLLYMFQCHSPKSSHPLPLPQSPKDCSIHQCLFFLSRFLIYSYIMSIFFFMLLSTSSGISKI